MNGSSFISSMGQFVAIIATFIVGTAATMAMIHNVDKRITVIELGLKDPWTGTNQMDWAHELQSGNEGLFVPDPRRIIEGHWGGHGR